MSYCQTIKAISDLKMATEILQGVPPLLKVFKDPLTKDNNHNFARGYPTEISFPVGPTEFSGFQVFNKSFPSLFCLSIATVRGGLINSCRYFSSLNCFRGFLPKMYLGSQNCGIFDNFNVEFLQRHPGLYGTP